MDAADAEMAFDAAWVECRAVPGYDPLTIAILEAKQSPAVRGRQCPGWLHNLLEDCAFFATTVTKCRFPAPLP